MSKNMLIWGGLGVAALVLLMKDKTSAAAPILGPSPGDSNLTYTPPAATTVVQRNEDGSVVLSDGRTMSAATYLQWKRRAM